jgi:hypothetical protein
MSKRKPTRARKVQAALIAPELPARRRRPKKIAGRDVKAFDASDLEQWLEQSVPAQNWISERLGSGAHRRTVPHFARLPFVF